MSSFQSLKTNRSLEITFQLVDEAVKLVKSVSNRCWATIKVRKEVVQLNIKIRSEVVEKESLFE